MIDSAFVRKLSEAVENNTALCVATVIAVEGSSPGKPGFKMLVSTDGSIYGTVGGGEAEMLVIKAAAEKGLTEVKKLRFELKGQPDAKDGTKMICGGAVEVLLEPVGKTDRLYILGGGHCGVALSRMAAPCGFAVTVIDDRPEWASPEKHPSSRVVCAPYAEVEKHVSFGPRAFVVIMTHGHDHDEQVLRLCLQHEYKYLGLIASKRKLGLFFERMEKDGVQKEKLAGIFSPIGFDIGSDTPAEIAVSIVAQMIAVRSGKKEVRFSSNPFLTGT
ncbi:MAG: XdhC/CoxI family protein [Candidatus Edwardsbacteria bacterium]|nr:XdhC/CoxI family protein [Candidatus Edwardsbacteria bacterium]